MHWIELSLDAAPEAIDWIATLTHLEAAGNQAVSIWYAPIAQSSENHWAFRVRLYLPNDAQSRTRIENLVERLTPLHRTGLTTELQVARLDAKPDFLDCTLAHPIGQRFVIVPPTATVPPELQNRISLRLAPSHAFGSGWHPATQLSLQLLERTVVPGMKILDLGCGSGILSVALAKLGAEVWAIDTDPTAVQATQAAVQGNQVQAAVTVQRGSLASGSTLGHWLGGEWSEPLPVNDFATHCWNAEGFNAIATGDGFDLIVANILARVHLALAADYRQALRPQSGVLITAGYTIDYAEEMMHALHAVGMECIDRQQSEEWIALVHRFPPQ